MPIDFSAMNDKVKNAHDQARSDKKAKAEEARKAADQKYAQCVSVLEDKIVPHLEEAISVFKSRGIDAQINKQFEVPDNPRVLLEFYTPKQSGRSWLESDSLGLNREGIPHRGDL